MLQSHLHSLIAKAHRYQEEPERFERISGGEEALRVRVHGANGDHEVDLVDGRLLCDCDGFAHRGEGICAHVLAVEYHFREEVPDGAVEWPFSAPAV
ncbi:MAG: SWIM zinc finger family protein [Chloroflexi bacterium]|nr:SWIM zinc finger family protein [Chloroflexota bacterium]MBV9603133.1 SWIM zinc finger family protein [Chloroflexota bacterium]